jgi:hypothetical protein
VKSFNVSVESSGLMDLSTKLRRPMIGRNLKQVIDSGLLKWNLE